MTNSMGKPAKIPLFHDGKPSLLWQNPTKHEDNVGKKQFHKPSPSHHWFMTLFSPHSPGGTTPPTGGQR